MPTGGAGGVSHVGCWKPASHSPPLSGEQGALKQLALLLKGEMQPADSDILQEKFEGETS